MKQIKIFITGWTFLLVLNMAQPVNMLANPVEVKRSIFDLLQQEEVSHVTLAFPWQYLSEHRRDTNEYSAILTYTDKQGRSQQWQTEVNLRGRFRRMRCTELPPIKINFKKDHLRAAGLTTHNDMKLVSYCKDDSDASKEALLKEYLAYQLYQEVSEASFRVHLLEITYIDSYSGETKTQFAFLIEDTAQLRDRLSANKPESERYLKADDFQKEARQNVAMFQYLIGNTDWSFTIPRNLKYIEKDGKIIPIPYDFDFSGFVSAPYALLTSRYGQSSLKDRVWLGFQEDEQLLNADTKHFENLKSSFHRLVAKFTRLSTDTRGDLVTYISAYFQDQVPITTIGQTAD